MTENPLGISNHGLAARKSTKFISSQRTQILVKLLCICQHLNQTYVFKNWFLSSNSSLGVGGKRHRSGKIRDFSLFYKSEQEV